MAHTSVLLPVPLGPMIMFRLGPGVEFGSRVRDEVGELDAHDGAGLMWLLGFIGLFDAILVCICLRE